jgi:hypothetical protein
MKYNLALLALLGAVNTKDFDGDGIDDTPQDAEEEEDEGMFGGEDEWYEED